MDIPVFIKYLRDKYLRDKQDTKLEQYIQYEKVLEVKTSPFFLPQSNLQEKSVIHEKIFKDCIKQAATNCHADDRIWKEFEWLFRDYCKVGGNLKQYGDGMRGAASIAWNVLTYVQSRPDPSFFGASMDNMLFPGLKENIQLDFCPPSFIYELKFTESDIEEYENNHITNDIMKSVLHMLISGVKPERVRLGILVYYWKLKLIVFYTTSAHQNGDLVTLLEDELLPNKEDVTEPNNEEQTP